MMEPEVIESNFPCLRCGTPLQFIEGQDPEVPEVLVAILYCEHCRAWW